MIKTKDEMDRALQVRVQWMRLMGMDDAQVELALRVDEPESVEAEQAQLNAMREIRGLARAGE